MIEQAIPLNDGRVLIFFRGRFTRQYYWRVRAANGKIVAIGGEGYKNRQDRDDIAHSLFRLRDRELQR